MGITHNPFSLENKTVLITGASSGIGRATAIECSKMGATCIIMGRNEQRLQQTYDMLAGTGHTQIIADLATIEGVEKLVEESPVIDGLVCNAGDVVNKPVGYYNLEDLLGTFGINTFSPMLTIKNFLKKKKIKSGGSIVFTSSCSVDCVSVGNGIYASSKSALTTYMRYCALELSPLKIRVNAVHPGMIETKLIHEGAISEADIAKDKSTYPLGRYGKPEEVAYAIIYLLSDAAVWVTGSSMTIDGGISLK